MRLKWMPETQSFVNAFSARVVHDPWWDSACEQSRAGDPYLLMLLKLRVLQETCDEFGISRAQGIQSLERYGHSIFHVLRREDEFEEPNEGP